MQPWQMMKYGQIVLFSFVPVAAYIMWQRLVNPALAIALSVVPQLVFAQPLRAYEVVSLATIVPWAIGSFSIDVGARGRRLPWWVAGIIGGIYFQLYMGYLMYISPALIALMIIGLWKSRDRVRYLWRLVGIGGVALVTAAWFLIPFVNGLLNYGNDRVADLWISQALSADPVPLSFTTWSSIGAFSAIGVLGMVFYWRTTWWAKPLALLTVGAFAYQAIFLVNFIFTGHTWFVHYVVRVTATVLMLAGLFTIAEAVPTLFSRLRVVWRPLLPAAAVGIVMAMSAMSLWHNLMPAPYGYRDAHLLTGTVNSTAGYPTGWNAAYRAHAEPLPNGSLPHYFAPGLNINNFPLYEVRAAVAQTLGASARPRSLTADPRFFSFLGWPGYVGPGKTSANTFLQWNHRVAALRQLGTVQDPAAFAVASQHTAFGYIDLFQLRDHGKTWSWSQGVEFSPSAFGAKYWDVYRFTTNDPKINLVVAVRKHMTN